MLWPTVTMAAIAIILLGVAYAWQGSQAVIGGLKVAGGTLLEILPLLILSFVVAGLVQVLLPRGLIAGWVGEESGWRGILIGSVAGGLTPGGPYVSLPLVAGLSQAGAGIGTMVAYMTGWSVWAVSRWPLEIGILGWRFTLIRVTSSLVLPPLAGALAQLIFSKN